MNDKIIDPRLFEVEFEEEEIPLFIVPSETNMGTSRFIQKKLKKRFNINPEINDVTYNLYFSLNKNRIPTVIEFARESDYVKALEIDDLGQEELRDLNW